MKQREHLAHMANQIAANFATMGDIDAAAATADHIVMFWDSRMKASLLADVIGLSSIASQAIDILRLTSEPKHVMPATSFTGRDGKEKSDAG